MIIFTCCDSGNKNHDPWEENKPSSHALSLFQLTASREFPVHMSGKGYPGGAMLVP